MIIRTKSNIQYQRLLKKIVTVSLIGLYISIFPLFPARAQNRESSLKKHSEARIDTSAKVRSDLKQYFKKNRPELLYYAGKVTDYGQPLRNFSPEQIKREINLYHRIKGCELIKRPNTEVFFLCHSILLHSPETGRAFLSLLNRPSENKMNLGLLYLLAVLTGEFGENIALENMESNDPAWKKAWSTYIRNNTVYESSAEKIEKMITASREPKIIVDLIYGLARIASPESGPFIKGIMEKTQNEYVQKAAIFTYAEIMGFYGIQDIEKTLPLGKYAEKEKTDTLEWLKKETNPKNQHGIEVKNDWNFVNRFADINSPAMKWMYKKGLLSNNNCQNNTPVPEKQVDKLLDLLIESRGFGLAAIKGSLLKSLTYKDIPKLLTLRTLTSYSPTAFSKIRLKILKIMIKYVKTLSPTNDQVLPVIKVGNGK